MVKNVGVVLALNKFNYLSWEKTLSPTLGATAFNYNSYSFHYSFNW